MIERQKTSEEYLNDVQIAIEQRHNEAESVLRYYVCNTFIVYNNTDGENIIATIKKRNNFCYP